MFRFFLTRFSLIIPTFIGVTLLTFALIRLVPGDPVELMAGERGISPERHAELRAAMGLDKPLLVQYGDYIVNVVQGDLGNSVVTRTPVLDEFLTLFPATIELSVCAILFAMIVGLPLGILAAVKRGSIFDHSLMGISLTGYSMPIFWWALLLILLFSVSLGWTPVSGRISVMYWVEPVTNFMLIDALLSDEEGAFGSALSHLILPAVVLGTVPLAVIARMTRSSMLEVLGEDYIRTANAKGLGPGTVLIAHALKNAAVPIVTTIGVGVALLIGGAVITESVFAVPGLGRLVVDAILRRDYPIIQGVILIFSAAYVAINLVVDIVYTLLDPRIRY